MGSTILSEVGKGHLLPALLSDSHIYKLLAGPVCTGSSSQLWITQSSPFTLLMEFLLE